MDLIEAVKLISNHCRENECVKCDFVVDKNFCLLNSNLPEEWIDELKEMGVLK